MLLPDCCEVGYSDVVAEGFEVEFSSLGRSFSAGEMIPIASFQCAVDGFCFAPLMVAFQECGLVFKPEGDHVAPWLASSLSEGGALFRLDDGASAFLGDEGAVLP